MLYGSCNDSEWWLAFIMHNLYTKLRAEGGGHNDLKEFIKVQTTTLVKINTNYIFFGAQQKIFFKKSILSCRNLATTQNFFNCTIFPFFKHIVRGGCGGRTGGGGNQVVAMVVELASE